MTILDFATTSTARADDGERTWREQFVDAVAYHRMSSTGKRQ